MTHLLQNVASDKRDYKLKRAPSHVTVVVPVPPSVNKMFRNVAGIGRVRTKLYDTWIYEAGWRLKLQHAPKTGGPVILLIAVERSWDRADIDNRVKPLLDLLVKHDVIDDDSNVVALAVSWAPLREGDARILIIPAADCTVQFQLGPDGKTGGWFLLTDPEGDD